MRAALLVLPVALAMAASTGAVREIQTTSATQPARPFVLAAAYHHPSIAIEPFARFTGSTWVNSWPPADESGSKPASLDRVPVRWLAKPVPRAWTLWPNAGAPFKSVVTGIVRHEGGCTAPLVLTLDPTPGVTIAVPDDGPPVLAVDTDQAVEGVRDVPASDSEGRALIPLVIKTFGQHESRLIVGAATAEHVQAARREIDISKLAIETTKLVRAAREIEPSLYYFEARKETSLKSGPLFGIVVRGWLRRSGQDRIAVSVSGGAYSDEGQTFATPLGIVRAADRQFWVFLLTHYESMEFAIDEITTAGARRLLRAGGSGC
jgi:hypothetical protein